LTIVIPMLGNSKRFFLQGYEVPKYMLPLGVGTVFSESIKSFERFFESEEFIFVVREDHDARHFVVSEANRVGIKFFSIVLHHGVTSGQAESVYIGLSCCSDDSRLIVFNIDTIRLNFEMPTAVSFADGFLEVFEADGDSWSFVLPGKKNLVLRTAEKERISNLCSNGLYGFGKVKFFKEAYEANRGISSRVNGELYVAPLYNYMIRNGKKITYRKVRSSDILNCGVPADYEVIKEVYKNQLNGK